MNPDKTNGRALISGLNLETEIDTAIMQLTLTYEYFSRKKMNAKPPANGAKPVKAFHLIQSFAPGECSAREAHAIGIEWVRQAFGEDYQAMVCTHTDHDHIHNHVLLCPYSLSGKKFNSNLNTLKRIRDVSDSICREQGIGIMEQLRAKPDHEPSSMSYGEWKHRKMGTSWKERIRVRIDLLVKSVNSLEELLSQLESVGYTIKRGKYISVKAPDQGRAVRLISLGKAYAENTLASRIEERAAARTKEKSFREFVDELWEEYRSSTGEFSKKYPDIYQLSHQLTVINRDHIRSIKELEDMINSVREEIEKIETEIRNGDVTSFHIDKYSERLDELRTKEKAYHDIIETFKLSDKGNYIDRIYNESQRRFVEQEQARKQLLSAESYEIYLPNNDNYPPLRELKKIPTTADYTKIFEGKMNFPDNERIGEKLEKIFNSIPQGRVGMIIKLGGTAYYTDDFGFKQLKRFDDSEPEQEHKKSFEQKITTKKKRER